MPDLKLVQLPSATTPLDGTELYYAVQNNRDVKVAGNEIVSIGGTISLTRSQIPSTTVFANTIMVSGFSTPGDLGVGAIYSSIGAGPTSTMAIQDATGTWFGLVVTDNLNVGWFGAKGNGVADDTVPLQIAITYATTHQATLIFGNVGNIFNITSALTIPFSQFWHFQGASRGTIIRQTIDNTPIFKFTDDLTHTFYISDFQLTWTNLQPSTNTQAVGIYFSGGDFNRFNFQIDRVTIYSGYRGIANDTSISPLTWGATIRDIVTFDMSGSTVNLGQAVSSGQPNVSIDGAYVSADLVAATEPIFNLFTVDGFSLNHVEVNTVNNSSQLLKCSSSNGRIGTIKVEGATFAPGDSPVAFANSSVSIQNISFATLTINAPGDSVTLISTGGAATNVFISAMELTLAAPVVGKLFLLASGDTSPFAIRLSFAPEGIVGTANVFLTDVTSTDSASGVSIDEWQQPRLSDDKGDADSTWTIGTDFSVIQYLTTLTGNRTITFTDEKAGASSNLYNGFIVRVVRNAGIPGAFTLTVKDSGGGTIGTIAANTNGWIDFMWQRFAWRKISAGTL